MPSVFSVLYRGSFCDIRWLGRGGGPTWSISCPNLKTKCSSTSLPLSAPLLLHGYHNGSMGHNDPRLDSQSSFGSWCANGTMGSNFFLTSRVPMATPLMSAKWPHPRLHCGHGHVLDIDVAMPPDMTSPLTAPQLPLPRLGHVITNVLVHPGLGNGCWGHWLGLIGRGSGCQRWLAGCSASQKINGGFKKLKAPLVSTREWQQFPKVPLLKTRMAAMPIQKLRMCLARSNL